ncbi:MAG: efflux RND transporter periplasmic adaptor subunit [Bacteroidaceae bacterium]|nr:efflux RND transporter periplasmic adaptor subunit [Bacteroidaceae bacterium]
MRTKTFLLALFTMVILTLSSCSKKATTYYATSKAEVQNISTSITATGTIEPVTKVEVGTQVSGIISKIYVDYNSIVTKGQVIAELDRTNLQSELVSAQSNLQNAQSNLNYQKSNYERYKALFDKGLVSANDFENARLTYEQAQAQVRVQQQSVQKAHTNLGYATITAPIDGVVLSKEVEEGQTVASAMTTPTLFIIAQDLTNMRVIANVDEADIGEVKEGQRVTFTVDAFPDDIFNGEVTQVRQEATTESNVVTYEVVISAPNQDLKLKPGLTANVTIFTLERNQVLTIPAKALRFTPNKNLLTEGEEIIDCDGKNKIWVREGQNFKAIPVNIGITNGNVTEIVSGIKAGQEMITEISVSAPEEENTANTNPFMPRPRGNKKTNSSGSSTGNKTNK